MKSARALLPAALLVLIPALAGCGGDDTDLANDTTTSSSAPVDRTSDAASDGGSSSSTATTESSAPAVQLPPTCDVVQKLDIATAFGVTPQDGKAFEGAAGTGSSDGEQSSWTTHECAFTAKDFLTATVSLAGPDDFSTPFTCPEQSAAEVTQATVKGADEASWAVDAQDPFDATLRACTEHLVLDVTVEFEPGYQHEGDPQAQSIGLAELILGRLR